MIELHLVARCYGSTKAKRSGLPYMNHIHEGLAILTHRKASDDAHRAWCLHPLLQSDDALRRSIRIEDFSGCSPRAIILAMEYRARANAWLSDKVMTSPTDEIYCSGQPSSGPIPEVREMLIADKVQNFKDCLLYQSGHPRYPELNVYFNNWLKALGISQTQFMQLSALINQST